MMDSNETNSDGFQTNIPYQRLNLQLPNSGIDYWQGAIVKCGIPAMAGSVTEAQSHDEGACIGVEDM